MPINERVIFDAAVEIPDSEARLAFVVKACEGDAELQARVLSLLKSHTDAGSFLEIPAAAPLGRGVAEITEKTIVGVSMGNDDDDSDDDESIRIDLSFLQPSAKSGSIGTLGHYEILKVLGQGGFGVVFKAFDEKLHRHVAIKVMNPQMAATSPPRKRFLREARSAAAIRHENIVAVHSVEEQPLPYLVMEFIDGQTLQQKLDGSGPLDVTEILYLGQQIASGLAAAHALSLIHRDIKPGNILIEGDVEQKVKITDFGLARAADDASLTRSGMISGTPMYMAPEQATGQALDHRTDLFSLGSVLYQMACGRPPFRAPNTVAVLRRVAEDTPRALQEIVPELPDWLVVIINKLLEKKPEDRYQSAKEVAELLGKCRSELQLTGHVACVATDGAESVRGRSTPIADVPTTPVYTPGDEWKNVPDGQRRFWKYLVPLIVFVVCLPVVTQLVKLPQPFTGFLMILALFLIGLPFLIHRARQRQVPAKTATQTSLRRVLYFMVLGMMTMFPILFGKYWSPYVNAWMWPAIPVLHTTNTASGLEFDGKDDFVSIEAVDWSYPQFTIEAFVTSAADSDNGTIVHLGSGGDKPEWMSLYDDHQADPGKRLSGAAIQGKSAFANTSAPLTPGVRQHRVLVFDGRYMHYYVNGIWQAKRFAEAHEGLMWKMKVLRIGCDGSERRFFQGRIDQVRISRVARYDENFAPITSLTSDDSTLALYKFDERTGEVLKDTSGNGHDGKIVGAKWVNAEIGETISDATPPGTEVSDSKSQISDAFGWQSLPADAPAPAIAPFDAEQAKQHQEAWAKYLNIPAAFTDKHGTDFVLIPPGEFLMGFSKPVLDVLTRELKQARAGEYDLFSASTSGPQHQVRITKPFYMSAHEVTVAEYRRFLDETHYMTTAEQVGGPHKKWTDYLATENPDSHPALGVSWTDAEAYCTLRSQKDGVVYRLPTEAEWEYACRAGTTTLWSFGENPADLNGYAVTSSTEFITAEPVGTRKPNPFGLYDMYGNAEEWCRDWHNQEFYAASPVDDPACLDTPADSNSGRVTRGGGFVAAVWQTRSGTRRWNFPSTPTGPIGFRVVITGDLSKVFPTIGVTAEIDTLEEIDNLPLDESQKTSDAEP